MKCHLDPMYLKTETKNRNPILKGTLVRPVLPVFSTVRLTYLLEKKKKKKETTDAMHYTKKGLHSIIKVLWGRKQEPVATCPGKVGTR